MALLLLSVFAAGCELGGGGVKKAPPPQPQPPVQTQPVMPPEPEPVVEDLEPRERYNRALELLQIGDTREARRHLELALQDQPGYRRASELLEQLQVDPIEYLGRKSFQYQVQRDESLSKIAEQFLGDPLKFVILARYNGIDNPSQLAVGQSLKIPGERPAPAVAPLPDEPVVPVESPVDIPVEVVPGAGPVPEQIEPAQAEVSQEAQEEQGVSPDLAQEAVMEPQAAQSETIPAAEAPAVDVVPDDSLLTRAQGLFDGGSYDQAIGLLESQPVEDLNGDAALTALLLDSYRAQGRALIDQRRWGEANTVLNRARERFVGEPGIVDLLTDVQDKSEAERYYKRALDEYDKGELDNQYAALRTMKDATILDPGNRTYADFKRQLQREIAASLHRKAIEHFQRQELNEAKAIWAKVLEVDPDNRFAPGYLERVDEILRRLEQ